MEQQTYLGTKTCPYQMCMYRADGTLVCNKQKASEERYEVLEEQEQQPDEYVEEQQPDEYVEEQQPDEYVEEQQLDEYVEEQQPDEYVQEQLLETFHVDETEVDEAELAHRAGAPMPYDPNM
jgi:hypothetical protein